MVIRSSIGISQIKRCRAARTIAPLLCATSIYLFALAGTSRAQVVGTDGVAPVGSSFVSAMSLPGAQRIWGGFVGADRGLGFEGSYFSLGGIAPLTTDMLDGTWFFDGRGHVSTGQGQFFGNFGIGRRGYFDPFRSIIGLSGWYDYDGDAYVGYGHSFNQLGVTGEMFNEFFDFRINGYMPVGTNTFLLSPNEFYQHNILVLNGIDSALTGFDSKFSLRPRFMQVWNGYIDIGGYGFKSGFVDSFGGVSTGFGVSPIPGWAVNMEVNHDNTFGTTGFIRVAFSFGASPGNSRLENRLLEPTRRNDHIVRYNQQPEYATNPVTGQLWNVVHVDNNNAPVGDGTAENPFKALKSAEAASGVNDIVYVHHGDGTARFYADGIILKNNQQLLGAGTDHWIATQEVGHFKLLATDTDNPIITNPNGNAVTLANNNVVSGLTIQYARTGIAGNNIQFTTIDRNDIQRSAFDSIQLTNFTGRADISNNKITQAGGDGVNVTNGNGDFEVRGNFISNSVEDGVRFVDSTGNFYSHDNDVNLTVQDGMAFENTTGSALINRDNLVSNGVGATSGLNVQQTSGRLDILAQDSTIQGNGTGVTIEAAGVGTVVNATLLNNKQITANVGDGIKIASRFGAVVTFSVYDNFSILANGIPGGGGAGLRLFAEDATMIGLVHGNNFLLNAGISTPVIDQAAGINGEFRGNTFTDLQIIRNVFNGNNNPPLGVTGTTSGNGIQLAYENTNTDINRLVIQDNTLTNTSGDGIVIFGGLSFTQNIIASNAVVDATLFNNTVTGSSNNALTVATGSNAVLRVTADGNTFSNNVNAGSPTILRDEAVSLISSANSRLIGIFTDNSIINNGSVPGADVSGIRAQSFNSSILALKATNNKIDSNSNRAILLEVANDSKMSALLRSNDLTHSGVQRDLEARIQLLASNVAVLGVELSSNNSSFGYGLTNGSLFGSSFGYNDNGLNVGTINTSGLSPVNLQPPGTIAALFNLMSVFP